LKTLIVNSTSDPAGSNIKERLLENYPFEESDIVFDGNPTYVIPPDITLASSNKGIVFVENLDGKFHPDRTVFISRHYAESGIPSLTAHFTGNFGRADFGGKSGEIARFSPFLLKTYMQTLRSLRGDPSSTYQITLEATHHGPTSMSSTVLFVELGSAEKQWKDVQAASKISQALMSSILSPKSYDKCGVCVGGTHYPEKFNKFLFDSEYALGPIIPKYALEYFSAGILKQILEKSDQPLRMALVDRKGLGKFKDEVMKTLDDFALEKISA
jgi:D-aminoacyl-tRNA deacylase